jgi:hypothetical protein
VAFDLTGTGLSSSCSPCLFHDDAKPLEEYPLLRLPLIGVTISGLGTTWVGIVLPLTMALAAASQRGYGQAYSSYMLQTSQGFAGQQHVGGVIMIGKGQ